VPKNKFVYFVFSKMNARRAGATSNEKKLFPGLLSSSQAGQAGALSAFIILMSILTSP
jgi:hypothetical protein